MVAANQGLPPAGTPGVRDGRNPTLLPNFNTSVATGTTVDHESPAVFLNNNPRVDATNSATIAGTVTSGEVTALILSSPLILTGGGQLGFAYTSGGSDTVVTIAEGLANLINNSGAAQALDVDATVADGVVTVNWGGPAGNFAKLSGGPYAAAPIDTITGTATLGDLNVVQFQGPNFNSGIAHQVAYMSTSGESLTNIAAGLAAAITADAVCVAAGISATNTAGVVDLVSAQEPLAITCWSAPVLETVTVGGSIVNGDSAILTITNAALAGGSLALTIPIVSADSDTTVAAKIAAAINGSQPLAALGITATSTGGVASINQMGRTGATTFARTNGADITFTLAAGGVNVATVGGSIVNGDSFVFTVTCSAVAGSPLSLTIPVVTGDSTTTLAAKLAAAINASLPLQSIGMFATSAAEVVSIGYGSTFGSVALSKTNGADATLTLSGGPTETHTFGQTTTSTVTISSAPLTGGSGPILVTNNFDFSRDGIHSQAFFYGNPYIVDYQMLTALVNEGMPIV